MAKDNRNLVLAVAGTTLISGVCSGATAWIVTGLLQSFQETSTMALLITSNGFASDDSKLEGNLNTAVAGLESIRETSIVLTVGSVMVAVALAYRLLKPGRRR